MSETTIRFNSRGEVILPFFVVGAPPFDLAEVVAAIDKAARAQRSEVG